MVKNVVILLFGGIYNGLIFDSNGVNAFNLYSVKSRKHFHGVHHVCNSLQALTEGVKFSKDVVLTELKLTFIWILSKLFLGSLELLLVFFIQLDAFI